MGVLQDIIREATTSEGDVPRMLRLCLVLGKRLNHQPLTQWVQQELEGYPRDASLPLYRKFGCRNRARFENDAGGATHDVPISALPESLQPHYATALLHESIGELVHLLSKSDGKGSLEIPWPPELTYKFVAKLSPNARQVRAWREISPAELAGMLDQVKTRVLSFALDIEREDVNAGNVPGTDQQLKEERVTQIFNTNFTGNVQNVANGSQHFTQTATTGVTPGDLASLMSYLRAQGLAEKDAASLKEAIDADQKATPSGEKQGGIGDAVKKWTGDLVTRATTGAVEMGLQKITDMVVPAVTDFLLK